jgi:site-specific recombinase XerD
VREKLKLDVNLYQATRHSLAINSKLDGSNLEDIGEVLGHTNPATTRIYAGVHLLNQKRVFQKSQQNNVVQLTVSSADTSPKLAPE